MAPGVGDLGRGTAVLTADGKYVLVAAASTVRLYSSVTGELVLSLNGHRAAVTAISLDHASNDKVSGVQFTQPVHPKPVVHWCRLCTKSFKMGIQTHELSLQVYSASQDGTVKHWNYASGQLLQSFTVGDPIHSMVRLSVQASCEMSWYSASMSAAATCPVRHWWAH